ncbi:MAG: MraY family glycosyltransferase [Methylococcaceae bacterium]
MNIIFYLTILILSYYLTLRVRRYALNNLMDMPNHRSSHSIPTPRGGGVAFVTAYYLGLLILLGLKQISLETGLISLAALPIVFVSWIDDHQHVPIKYRIVVQATSTLCMILFATEDLLKYLARIDVLVAGFFLVMVMLVIIWFINLYNFMDGIDALAGMEFVSIMLGIVCTLLILGENGLHDSDTLDIAQLGLASVLGFLILNWPPAKIFMGDVGSNFLGYLVAAMAVTTIVQHQLNVSTWLILPAVFWIDATLTLARRIGQGQPFYKAHRNHAYQHAALYFQSHEKVSLAITLINILYLLPLAILSEIYSWLAAVFVALAYIPLLLLAVRFNAGIMHNKSPE